MNDANGNHDVMGSKPMSPSQLDDAHHLRLAFNALHAMIVALDDLPSSEAARLFAISKTHLEIACMTAIKGVSRL